MTHRVGMAKGGQGLTAGRHPFTEESTEKCATDMMSFVELLLYSDSGLGVSSDKGRNVERSDRMTRVC